MINNAWQITNRGKSEEWKPDTCMKQVYREMGQGQVREPCFELGMRANPDENSCYFNEFQFFPKKNKYLTREERTHVRNILNITVPYLKFDEQDLQEMIRSGFITTSMRKINDELEYQEQNNLDPELARRYRVFLENIIIKKMAEIEAEKMNSKGNGATMQQNGNKATTSPSNAQQIVDFCEENGFTPNDLALALSMMQATRGGAEAANDNVAKGVTPPQQPEQ